MEHPSHKIDISAAALHAAIVRYVHLLFYPGTDPELMAARDDVEAIQNRRQAREDALWSLLWGFTTRAGCRTSLTRYC